jgi:DNA-directed RNA polymerase specialized sigma24 family protein
MDSSLVVRAQQGDRGAFSDLVDAIGGRLHAIAYSVLRDRELARDATQQTLLTAWQDLPRLRDPDRFEAWTCRILVRNCHAEARRASHWLPISLERPMPEPSVADDTATVIARDRIERGFRRLNFYLDLPPAVIADQLGMPVGTVHSRLHRALHSLHAAIDADERALVLQCPPSPVKQEATR